MENIFKYLKPAITFGWIALVFIIVVNIFVMYSSFHLLNSGTKIESVLFSRTLIYGKYVSFQYDASVKINGQTVRFLKSDRSLAPAYYFFIKGYNSGSVTQVTRTVVYNPSKPWEFIIYPPDQNKYLSVLLNNIFVSPVVVCLFIISALKSLYYFGNKKNANTY